MKPQFADGTPPGSLSVCHKSGWMQLQLFEKWFDHFLRHNQASKSNPALLMLDGHKTHTQNIATIEQAREKGVTTLCLPPHTSQRMRPLDVSFIRPMSTFYTQKVEIWLRNHPGRCVTINEVGSLLGKAFLRASTPLNAVNGFNKAGLYPLDRTKFTEDMFAVTSHDAPQNHNTTENDAVATVMLEMGDVM
ncbi:DDE superfamily endonuclease [Popillia japonica]|uniref:DDE superfamily endonuclease n=1 Tax=Popillia japonica TaxID=7064 RepID=A0AAW1KIH2_POPJA